MKKLLKLAVFLLVVAFVAIQFFRPSFSNPPLMPGQPIEEAGAVPPEIQMLLSRSCNDCHSNKTVYPWYAQVAPFSWFLADHISEGRRELNFSEWGSYPVAKRERKLEEICEMVESGSMPLSSYLWIHREAALSPDQRRAICEWSAAERAKLGSR